MNELKLSTSCITALAHWQNRRACANDTSAPPKALDRLPSPGRLKQAQHIALRYICQARMPLYIAMRYTLYSHPATISDYDTSNYAEPSANFPQLAMRGFASSVRE